METQVRTPNGIFGQPQRMLIPLFQRPYVWNEEQQWEPHAKLRAGARGVACGVHENFQCSLCFQADSCLFPLCYART